MNKTVLVVALACLAVAACDIPAPRPGHKIDLKSPPANVSAERHKGVFAEGSALSTGPQLKPLDPAPVKTIRLDTTHKIVEIAPGV